MSGTSMLAVVVGTVWIAAWLAALALIVRGWLRRPGDSRRAFPALYINGTLILAIAPIAAAIQQVIIGRFSSAGPIVVGVGAALLAYGGFLQWRHRDSSQAQPATTFYQRSIVAQIAAIVFVYGGFAVQLWGQPLTVKNAVATLIGITVSMIVILVVAHVAMALHARPEALDERDAEASLRGTRNAYRALSVGLWCVMLLLLSPLPGVVLFYALMLVFALSELVRLGSQLLYFRFGI